MNISYENAKKLIKEADILLFRARPFPNIGWWIGKYTKSIYSHTALAHWENDTLYAVEFKEFKGGRIHPMDLYVTQKDGKNIDVFRTVDTVICPYIETINNENWVAYKELNFTNDKAIEITSTAKDTVKKIGKYSYWTIWQMFKTYVPIIRLRTKIAKNGEPDPKNFVCSTLVTYTYRKHFIDPVPFLSDEYTTPGDLARSAIFSYIFSISN